mmetsp:Transcript_16570/g.62999  ORF Transcript_16570/g.62999 Transcript_16570/m.62999 type:complete len:140 (+) Transcript_16570:491-910(+)
MAEQDPPEPPVIASRSLKDQAQLANMVEEATASLPMVVANDLVAELLNGAAGPHGDYTRHVCEIVKAALAKCAPGDTARIVGTLAGVVYLSRMYARQHSIPTMDVHAVEAAVSRVMQQHAIPRGIFGRLLFFSEKRAKL